MVGWDVGLVSWTHAVNHFFVLLFLLLFLLIPLTSTMDNKNTMFGGLLPLLLLLPSFIGNKGTKEVVLWWEE
jgi:hypothetical protein